MRVGQNPLKRTSLPIPQPVTSCGVITHYTSDAYHKDRLEIVRRCINSIKAAKPDELIIWDNGSTPEFLDMLRSLNPTVLVQSVNVGIGTAKRNLFEIARGEIFCYSDDDVYHEAGWMETQCEILETYPNAGTVSGSPMRLHFKYGNESNMALADRYGMKIQRGYLIPENYEIDFAESIGIKYSDLQKSTAQLTDTLLEYKDVKAWAHGHHMQFTCYRKMVKKYFEPDNIYMRGEREQDRRIDSAGFMRLTTYERTVRHINCM